MNIRADGGNPRLDDAARAGWLYYVAGNTQDQIAGKARRLAPDRAAAGVAGRVGRADQGPASIIRSPIASTSRRGCSRASRLTWSRWCRATRTSSSTTIGIAEAAAAEIERWLRSEKPIVMAIGTGRTLKAAIEQLPPMDCPQHKVVSLTGNISPDGSAAFYNVIFTMADRIKARSFPMPLPVISSSAEEREMLLGQPMIQPTLALAAQADVTFVGIGDLGPKAPLYEDGFITEAELKALQKAGGVAEIVGWVFDRDGRLIEGITNDRVASAPLPSRERSLVIALAMGEQEAARHPRRGDAAAGQRPDHRRAHGSGVARRGLDGADAKRSKQPLLARQLPPRCRHPCGTTRTYSGMRAAANLDLRDLEGRHVDARQLRRPHPT